MKNEEAENLSRQIEEAKLLAAAQEKERIEKENQLKEEQDKIRKEQELKELQLKELKEKEQKDQEIREKAEREEKEAKEKAEKAKKAQDEKEKKEKAENEKKQKEEKEKREKEEKDRREKDEREEKEKKDKAEKEKKAKEEKDRKEKEDKERKDKERKDKEEKDRYIFSFISIGLKKKRRRKIKMIANKVVIVAPVEMENVQSAVPDLETDQIDNKMQGKSPTSAIKEPPKSKKSSKKLKEQKTEGSGDKIHKKKSSKKLVHGKSSKDAIVLSDEEGKKEKSTPIKKKSEKNIEKIPVSLEPAEDSPREIDEEAIKKKLEIGEKENKDEEEVDNDEDKFSYQQKQDDEREYQEDDDQSISDIRRAKDTEEEPYMFWTREQWEDELKKDSKSIKAHFRLGLICLEEDNSSQSRVHFVDFLIKSWSYI